MNLSSRSAMRMVIARIVVAGFNRCDGNYYGAGTKTLGTALRYIGGGSARLKTKFTAMDEKTLAEKFPGAYPVETATPVLIGLFC